MFSEPFKVLLKVFGNETMSRTRTYEWYRRFKDGRMAMADDPRSEWTSASTDDDSIELVRSVIR
jgi:hypothetical protein